MTVHVFMLMVKGNVSPDYVEMPGHDLYQSPWLGHITPDI
jgi:hypothetical protein